MILLDTNVLIRMLVEGTLAADRVSRWIALAGAAIADRVIPFTADHARESSRLWNATGRARRIRIDAMISAASIVTTAELATENRDDFAPFVTIGLHLNDDVR